MWLFFFFFVCVCGGEADWTVFLQLRPPYDAFLHTLRGCVRMRVCEERGKMLIMQAQFEIFKMRGKWAKHTIKNKTKFGVKFSYFLIYEILGKL